MNPLKTLSLTLAAIIAIAMLLSVIQLLLKKLKPVSEADSRIRTAYGVWFGGLFVAASLVAAKAIVFLAEAMDNVYKIGAANLIFELVKVSALYVGLSVLWFLLWFFIGKLLTSVMMGTRNDPEEMALNNTGYFLIRGLLVAGLIFCLSPVLDSLFRAVMPNIPLPFYH
jgi:hypothetical protein